MLIDCGVPIETVLSVVWRDRRGRDGVDRRRIPEVIAAANEVEIRPFLFPSRWSLEIKLLVNSGDDSEITCTSPLINVDTKMIGEMVDGDPPGVPRAVKYLLWIAAAFVIVAAIRSPDAVTNAARAVGDFFDALLSAFV